MPKKSTLTTKKNKVAAKQQTNDEQLLSWDARIAKGYSRLCEIEDVTELTPAKQKQYRYCTDILRMMRVILESLPADFSESIKAHALEHLQELNRYHVLS